MPPRDTRPSIQDINLVNIHCGSRLVVSVLAMMDSVTLKEVVYRNSTVYEADNKKRYPINLHSRRIREIVYESTLRLLSSFNLNI